MGARYQMLQRARKIQKPPFLPAPAPALKYGHLIPTAMTNWFANAEALLPMIEARRPAITIEVGSWLGSSAIQIAKTVRPWGGLLICVDHWQGDPSWYTQEGMPEQIAASYYTFRHNLARHGVDNVMVCRGRSLYIASTMPARSAGVIYIDASHDEDNVRKDIAAWWPIVKPGGILAGDDYGSERWTGCTVAWDDTQALIGVPPHTEKGPGIQGLVWVEKPPQKKAWALALQQVRGYFQHLRFYDAEGKN